MFLPGPSGAGKSTLLHLLLCQERSTSGQLTVDRESLTLMGAGETQAYRRHVGFIFQDFKLIDRMTVAENTAFVLRVMGEAETMQRRRVEQALKWVGLEDRMDAYPSELSGGEQQRVAIARALINRPMMRADGEPGPGSGIGDHKFVPGDQYRWHDGAGRDPRPRGDSPGRRSCSTRVCS